MSSLKFDLTAIEADRKTIYTIYGKDRVFTELAICLNCVPACWSYDKKSRVFWTTTMCSNACGQREWISECVPYLEKRLGSSKRQLRRLLTCKTSKRDAIPDLEDKTVSLIWISKNAYCTWVEHQNSTLPARNTMQRKHCRYCHQRPYPKKHVNLGIRGMESLLTSVCMPQNSGPK